MWRWVESRVLEQACLHLDPACVQVAYVPWGLHLRSGVKGASASEDCDSTCECVSTAVRGPSHKVVVVFICLSFIYPCCRIRTAECLVQEDLLRLVASCSQVGRWPRGVPPWLQHRARCPGGPLCGVKGQPAHSAYSSVTACGCASQMSPQYTLLPAFFLPPKKRPQMPFISPPTLSEVGLP